MTTKDTEKKSPNQRLQDKLLYKRESGWLHLKKKEQQAVFAFGEEYKNFLAVGKTERLCVANLIGMLEAKGFRELGTVRSPRPGTGIYKNYKDKTLIAAVLGTEPTALRIVGSHVDSPRLDLKPTPLYEDAELALLQSHYYGGIKKYHWVNVPLALHGVAITRQGRRVAIHLGEGDDEPRFIIPDLLPHLAREQMKKDGGKLITGEQLNIICGHLPVQDKGIKEKIKFNVLKYLHEQYDLIEEDFAIAELELVPAGRPVDIGFDRGLIGAYGQDDRVCVFTSARALLETVKPQSTAVGFWVDKEEIGSSGDTGADSLILHHFVAEYCRLAGVALSPLKLLEEACSISADVTSAMDPTFKEVSDPQNTSYLGRGVSVEKYGGGGGKFGTQDTRTEYMAYMRDLLIRNKIVWQTGESGKIDVGGGGTIAKFMARYGMDCVDAGPCMLGMHSTCEVTSKFDLYSAYRLYKAFFNDTQRA